MGVNAQFPINNLSGPLPIPSTAVPAGATKVALSLDYTTMSDPALLVDLTLEISLDNGQTWKSFASVQGVKGGRTARDGSPITTLPLLNADLPAGANRRVRGSLVASGVPLTTTAFVVTEP